MLVPSELSSSYIIYQIQTSLYNIKQKLRDQYGIILTPQILKNENNISKTFKEINPNFIALLEILYTKLLEITSKKCDYYSYYNELFNLKRSKTNRELNSTQKNTKLTNSFIFTDKEQCEILSISRILLKLIPNFTILTIFHTFKYVNSLKMLIFILKEMNIFHSSVQSMTTQIHQNKHTLMHSFGFILNESYWSKYFNTFELKLRRPIGPFILRLSISKGTIMTGLNQSKFQIISEALIPTDTNAILFLPPNLKLIPT